MHGRNRIAARALAGVAALGLWMASVANAQPANAKSALAAAQAAYQARDYAEADRQFGLAIAAGDTEGGTYYDAACAASLAGRLDRAFSLLRAAMDAGFTRVSLARTDPDLAAMRGEPRWAPLIADFEAKNPADSIAGRLANGSVPASAGYFEARRALRNGMPMPDPRQSTFQQLYGTVASFMGQYDQARSIYVTGGSKPTDLPAGYTRAEPALPEILSRAARTRVVLLNESHAEAQTRASIFTLLAPLRALGYTHLGMEALATSAPAAGAAGCSRPTLGDTGLVARGYPVAATGYYTQEPVDAELLREALRLGFILVPYESIGNTTQGEREQQQADNLACVLKDPAVKLVVVAGFGHIREAKEGWVEGGQMGYRLREATGLDPLSVDSTLLVKASPASLQFPEAAGAPGQAWVLRDADGRAYGNADYDLILYTEAEAHRNDPSRRSWLELGGARRPVAASAALCGARRPCLLQAMAAGESSDAVASDRCVVDEDEAGCRLFLRPGSYRLLAEDEHQARLGEQALAVGHAGEASSPLR